MKKNLNAGSKPLWFSPLLKLLLIMKMIVFLLFVAGLTATYANSDAQTVRLNLNLNGGTVRDVIEEIERQTNLSFMYDNNVFKVDRPISINVENESIKTVLEKLILGEDLKYEIVNRYIVITANNTPSMTQQLKTVKGRVTDSSGSPIVGVTVVVKGTNVGTVTNSDGGYALSNVPGNATLLFSFVGMKTQEAAVGNKTAINIVLADESVGIEEVVAVGYGTQKKVNLSGALSVVSEKELNNSKIGSVAAMLQGRLSGLSVVQSSGEPGKEDVSLIVRGRQSFGGNLSPLIIVDGIPVTDMSAINANSIESVTALKDATSSAIYGSRAAGGVILITTKQGKEGKEVVTYDGNVAVYAPTQMPDLITNSAEYMEMYNKAKQNRYGATVANQYSQDAINAYRNANGDPKYPNTNWIDILFSPAVVQNHTVGITGGGKNSTHNITMGFIDQPGTMKGFSYKKYTLQLNVTSHISDKVKVGVTTRAMYGERKGAGGSVSSGMGSSQRYSQNILEQAIDQAPTYGPKLDNGSYVSKAFITIESPKTNPLATIENTPVTEKTLRFEASAYLKIALTDWLTWENRGGFNINDERRHSFSSKVLMYYWDGTLPPRAQAGSVGGDLGASDAFNRMINPVAYSTLNFQKEFGGHNISAMVGTQAEYTKTEYFSVRRQDFLTSEAQQIDAGVNNSNQFTSGNAQELALMSFFGRVNYNYKGKYLLEFDARADGSSRFAPGKRWGIFPSGSMAWRPFQESFMPQVPWLSDLKIRGSFGVLGNQSIGDNYLYQSVLTSSTITGSAWSSAPLYAFDKTSPTQGFAASKLLDPSLSWETTYSTNLGIDISLFRNRLNFNLDWYYKKTVDILVPDAKLPYSSGFSTSVQALGSMRNKGLEATISFKDKIRDFNYGINLFVQGNRNMVLSYPSPGPWGKTIYAPGLPYGSYFLNIFDGIRQQPEVVKLGSGTAYTLPAGTMIIRDIHGPSSSSNYGIGVGGPDGIVNRDGDREVVSGAYPKFESGLTLTASWKGFDISCFFYGVYGVKQYIEGAGWTPFDNGIAPPSTMWRDAWTPENHSEKLPMLAFGNMGKGVWYNPLREDDDLARNTFSLVDGSYLRLKNLNVGYTFNLNKFGVQNLRVYFSGDNLMTITNYPGEPERQTGVYTDGTAARDYNNTFLRYPQNKVYSLGINLKF